MLLGIIGKSADFGVGLTRVQIPALLLTSFVTLSKLFNSKLSLFIYKRGMIIASVSQSVVNIK